MYREDLQKKMISRVTTDYTQNSPERNSIIPDPSQLERMKREKKEYALERIRMLSNMAKRYEQKRQAILRQIQASIQDSVLPSARPLVEMKGCSSMFSCSDQCSAYMQPHPPLNAPRKQYRAWRRSRVVLVAELPSKSLKNLVSDQNTETGAMEDHQAATEAQNAQSMGCSVGEMSSPVDSEELRSLPALQMPVHTPVAAKHSRLPRLTSLLSLTKAQKKAYSVTVNKKDNTPSSRILRADNVTLDQVADKNSRFKEPESKSESVGQRAPTKMATVTQRRRAEANVQPVGHAAEVSEPRQRAEVRENPGLVSEQPLVNPELSMCQTFQLLQQEEWEKKIEGLKLVHSLAEHHTDILLPRLLDVCLAVADEVKNLRSMVSRAAMITLAQLYARLGKKMDKVVDWTTHIVLQKATESSTVLKKDVEVVLSMMVYNCSPTPVLAALLAGGFSHKSSAVRRCTALHLQKLAERLGTSYLLKAKKQFTCSFLTALSKLAVDSAQEVRNYAKCALKILSSHKDFLKMVDKVMSATDQHSFKDILRKVR